jgi:hypothetical protein
MASLQQSSTMSVHIRAAGALARPQCRPSLASNSDDPADENRPEDSTLSRVTVCNKNREMNESPIKETHAVDVSIIR